MKETLDSEVTAHINSLFKIFEIATVSHKKKLTKRLLITFVSRLLNGCISQKLTDFQDLKIMCILPTFADSKACGL